MIVDSRGRLVLGLIAVLAHVAGCETNNDGGVDAPPPPPVVTYEGLDPHEWSLATVNGQMQISISDVASPTACAASTDQHNTIGAAGGQIIIHLAMPVTETCPNGSYDLSKCSNLPGNDAFVTTGCGFYRKYDAAGAVLGSTPSLTGLIKFSGTASTCTMIVTVGFLGRSFTQQATFVNGQTAQPWCVEN
ncbi:MAG TPA: hypothetical protein VFP84_40725 [Kofleriaceae bacterium]|nr:hypothetical protein [Kofleriaceae bacterium]